MKANILIIIFVIFLMFSCKTLETSKNESNESKKNVVKEESIKGESIKLIIDKAAFDPEKPMNIYDNKKQIICYYDRITNKSGGIRGAKIISLDNKVKYTIMPVINMTKIEIFIKNDEEKTGKISIEVKPAFVTIVYKTETDFFGKPYEYKMDFINAMFAVTLKSYVKYNNENIIKQSFDMSMVGANQTEVEIDKNFFEGNKIDSATWCIIFQIVNEINMELSKGGITSHH